VLPLASSSTVLEPVLVLVLQLLLASSTESTDTVVISSVVVPITGNGPVYITFFCRIFPTDTEVGSSTPS
jgi:hypothetical protein